MTQKFFIRIQTISSFVKSLNNKNSLILYIATYFIYQFEYVFFYAFDKFNNRFLFVFI